MPTCGTAGTGPGTRGLGGVTTLLGWVGAQPLLNEARLCGLGASAGGCLGLTPTGLCEGLACACNIGRGGTLPGTLWGSMGVKGLCCCC